MDAQCSAETTSNILLVDDEENILSALNRTLRNSSYKIFTAKSGNEGLNILRSEKIHLIISDMQMPGMNGAQFLREALHRSPNTIRMVLTGYADMYATIQAINESKVYCYLNKPWKKDQLLQTISLALYTQTIDAEKKRLLGQARKQNAELQKLNTELESKLTMQKGLLSTVNCKSKRALTDCKSACDTTVNVFYNMVSQHDLPLIQHGKRVAAIAVDIAKEMALPENDIDCVYYAGLLHDIGETQLNDVVKNTAFECLDQQEKQVYHQHSVFGESLLTPLDKYYPVSSLIRHHHERYNGLGYPDQLAGDEIALGSAILAVAEDFDEACCGKMFERKITRTQAIELIERGSGRHYHPDTVRAFLSVVSYRGKHDVH